VALVSLGVLLQLLPTYLDRITHYGGGRWTLECMEPEHPPVRSVGVITLLRRFRAALSGRGFTKSNAKQERKSNEHQGSIPRCKPG